jgi:Zn-dependent protease with chaperone function
MADIASVYPPTPVAVPVDLTTPSREYRFRVLIVLLCLLVFVAVYLCLTVGSAYACYTCFASLRDDSPPSYYSTPSYQQPANPRYPSQRSSYTPPRQRSEKPVFWLIIGGIACGLLFLFMVKGLFKQARRDPGVRVEVTEREQPVLFAFIRQVCKDTGAPFPHRVFLVPDVNASVSFHESILNLVFPSRKNLIIGLGLVNRLNLTEFKAVLAHEFGHFSQNSMKLGSYVYTANRVIGDVVYGRDWLDDALGAASRTDIRIAVFAWAFMAVLWVMREALKLLFRGINFAHVSLSRQMEYNADLVAVSVTGSDALIFALARLDFASESLGQAWTDLTAAADHHRFTRDLYYHQTKAAEYLKAKRNDPKLGEVPPLPDDPTQTAQVFKPEDTSVPTMWATHPSNFDRESNAKQRYVRGPVDERSAWELFAHQPEVKGAVTLAVYTMARKDKPSTLEDPEAIQAFIDAEHAETTYDPRYQGLYENRYIKPGELLELCMRACWREFDDREKLAAAHAAIYGPGLKERMDAHKTRQEEVEKLAKLTHGAVELRGSDFEFRGWRYRLADAPRLLKEVEEELDRDFKWMHSLDREVFRVHYAMAAQLGDAERTELEEWYRFHLAVEALHSVLAVRSRNVQATLSALSGRREVSQGEFQAALQTLRETQYLLQEQLGVAKGLKLPPLRNMTAGEPLGPFLLSEPLVPNLSAGTQTLDGAWIGRLLTQMGEVIDKTARILFKSLGGLLALQERLAERWATPATPPTPADSAVPVPAETPPETPPSPPTGEVSPEAPKPSE